MSQKNIKFQSHKAKSHDENKIVKSSQHSKNKKNLADHLRGEICLLIQKQDVARAYTKRQAELYQYFKAQGKDFESETEFHWLSFQTWSDENRRLFKKIQVKLKAVQKYEKYEQPKQKKEPNIIDKKKQYMKYGPSDEDE